MSGWNIQIETSNFSFAPEHASNVHEPGEGHAHLYINGKKIARMYGPWIHVPELLKARNTIKVTLNTNDHQTITVDGKPVEKSIKL